MRRFSCLLLGLFAFPVAAQPAGQQESVQRSKGSPKLVFVYCPPGKHLAGDPARNTISDIPKGYWIAQTEMTQGAFFDLLANLDGEAKAKWSRRGARLDKAAYAKLMFDRAIEVAPTLGEKEVVGDDFPIFCIGLHEAALACAALNAAQDRSGPVSRSFRLPSADEWEYACRARSRVDVPAENDSTIEFDLAAQNFPYFTDWKRWNEIPESRRNKIIDIWKNHGPDPMAAFTGRQKQMIDLLSHVKDKDAIETLSNSLTDLLKQSLDIDHSFLTVGKNRLERADKRPGNRWGVRNMHGNVAEWVLPTIGADASWKALLNDDAPISTKALIRGGQFRHGGEYVTSEEKWLAFTIGHSGEEKTYDQAAKTEYPSYFAGIRLVMTREADPARWLARLHKEVSDGPLPAKAWLDGLDAGIEQIKQVDEPEAAKAGKQTAYLRTQYLTRAGDRAGAADALGKVTGGTEDEKLFLGALGSVMKADAARK